MYDSQVALHRDNGQINRRRDRSQPAEAVAEYHRAQPVAGRSAEVNVAQPCRVDRDQRETGEQFESVLVHDEHVRLVLFGGHQGVEMTMGHTF